MDLKGRVQLKENKVNVSWENICVPFQWFDWLERWNVAARKECRHNSANWVCWKFRSIVKYGIRNMGKLNLYHFGKWPFVKQRSIPSTHTHTTRLLETHCFGISCGCYFFSHFRHLFLSFHSYWIYSFVLQQTICLKVDVCVCVLGQAHRHSYVLCGFGFQTAPNICLECIHTDICLSFSVFSLEFF